ncbi:hypothetical protein EB73_02430 [Mycobacterium sp. SWH-M3]|nr:hypothetical protein EB73_02430 [Mycobacterium sp. SWH-M3]
MEHSTIATISTTVSLWLALAVMALSAFMTIARTSRRDKYGFVDRSALDAISLVIGGPVLAAIIVYTPIMVRSAITPGAPTASVEPGPWTYLLSDAWSWVATFIAIAWLYAAASTILVTYLYFRQQRRTRAADTDV